ncbi:hypothetical protein BKA82DRAFT_996667 [Pisolithus tinctorius]|uniref:DUF6534 domain-containing protein n=1 Tax=Pisolithus tinctorius Marx 270 TaxID=870435 RepID=A0A0C3P8J6_PISTI|nr:hypothetical protein BKA82DRAFT_996667 [Pisolithus tinctorius]KIO09790.1 hypothetical protein M404DRAFT_996667 [Pisolithus tinctorius Marx 270]
MGIPGELGPILIGGLVSAALYGITTLQTYVYFMHYAEDASTKKFLVAVVWVLDTLHVSLTCHILYYYMITSYGVPTSLEYNIWSLTTSFLVNILMVCITQLFFAHILYYLCRPHVKWLVTTPIMLLVLAHFGFGMVSTVLEFVNNKISVLTQIRFYGVTPTVATVVLAETLITVSLCILLYDSGSYLAFPGTKRLVNTLIVYAVNRCLLTLLVAIAELVMTANENHAWLIGLNFIIGKLYANSLLASLNTRQYLRSLGSGIESAERVDAIHFADPANSSWTEGVRRVE